jgi:S-DNA-T family DNA segregation ATPase FtsK/SpoIIIE
VSDPIRANTNLRIALRVQEPADSDDVVGRPDAARIGRGQPGRALVRLGPGEVEVVQTALSTGVAPRGGHGSVEIRPFRFGPQHPSATPPPAADTAGARTDLDRLVDAAVEAHRGSGRPAPRRPWPDPLPAELDLADLAHRSDGALDAGIAPFALADDPDGQAQRPAGWDPATGNLLLAGIPGSGTSTACASIVLALAARSHPDDLHVHVLDLGAGGLAPLAGLAHVGSVVTAPERERQARLVRALRAELDRRRGDPGPPADRVRTVLVLDGVGAFRAEWEDSFSGVWEDLQRVFADGPGVGLHTVVAADRAGALPHAMQALVRQRWQFRTGDPLELTALGLQAGAVPDLGPGRAIVAEHVLEVQVARPADGLDAAVARLAATSGQPARRPPATVRALPHEVRLADLLPAAHLDADPWSIPVGVGGEDLGPARLTLHEGEHALVAGPPRSGRTTTLRTVAAVVRATRPEVAIVTVAPGSVPRAALAEIAGGTGPALVLVDDADLVDDDDRTLAALLASRRPDLHVVVAGRNDALRSQYGHWARAARAGRAAVLLQPDPDLDGDLAGTTLPRRSIVALGPGRGYVVCDGAVDVVQIAALHERYQDIR